MAEIRVKANEDAYLVKLFHPIDPGLPCPYQGKSDSFTVTASDPIQLRTEIESTSHRLFSGDTCKRCGSLAKVSSMRRQPSGEWTPVDRRPLIGVIRKAFLAN